MKVYLVRHADAGDRDAWTGDDRQRPLSDKGWKQARGLLDRLGGDHVERILSSPYLRCRQTVEPLAAALGLECVLEDALAEGSHYSRALDLIRDADQPTVMCSQGDVIGALVTQQLVAAGMVRADEARWSKASVWELTTGGGSITEARYLPPG